MIDENHLINSIIENYNNNLNYKQFLILSISEIVANNTIGQNQEIILHYSGDIYDAITLYTYHFKHSYNFRENKETFSLIVPFEMTTSCGT